MDAIQSYLFSLTSAASSRHLVKQKSSLHLLFASVFSSKTLSGNCDEVPSSPNTLSVGRRDSLGGVPSSSAPVIALHVLEQVAKTYPLLYSYSKCPSKQWLHFTTCAGFNHQMSVAPTQEFGTVVAAYKYRATNCLASPKLWQCSLMRFDLSSALPATQFGNTASGKSFDTAYAATLESSELASDWMDR